MTSTVLFTRSKALSAKIICFLTRSKWSHASLVVGSDELIESDAYVGVQEATISGRINASVEHEFRIYDYDADHAAANAQALVGKAYDWVGLLGIGRDNDKWYCSELVSHCLEIRMKGEPVISPQELYELGRPVLT